MNCIFKNYVLVYDFQDLKNVPRRPVLERSPANLRFVVDKVALGEVFSPSASVFLGLDHFTNAPYSSSSQYYTCENGNKVNNDLS
jgi:hypothetical protein